MDHSFECPRCGDWLPTQESYARWRGHMNPEHICYCGATVTKDELYNYPIQEPPRSAQTVDEDKILDQGNGP